MGYWYLIQTTDMNTGSQDIYIISAIRQAWKHKFHSDFNLNMMQSLNISDELEYINDGQVHDRVDVVTVYLDDMDSERVTNKQVVAVSFAHYHRQQRPDNWGVTVYIK